MNSKNGKKDLIWVFGLMGVKGKVATTTQGAPELNPKVVTCYECGRQGHYWSDCPKLKNKNRGNRSGNKPNKARGRAYALGGGGANCDSNIVMGTFLLNNHHARMLFDSSADRSFVSNTFSLLLDIVPSTLDVSYAVELADKRIVETNTLLRGCMLVPAGRLKVWYVIGIATLRALVRASDNTSGDA
nr:reverse transcriptase domain-containing protein [Tanacetum cinerariifolium]